MDFSGEKLANKMNKKSEEKIILDESFNNKFERMRRQIRNERIAKEKAKNNGFSAKKGEGPA